MDDLSRYASVRDRLIQAGIEELNTYGVKDFSVRRVAEKCAVSCAAPYKHFKDKQAFIHAIMDYIYAEWSRRQQAVLRRVTGPLREQIVEICLEYIRFLMDYPYFRSAIMARDESLNTEYRRVRSQISQLSARLVDDYCREMGIPDEAKKVKVYIVRSLIYGAALLFDNQEMEYNEENMQRVAYAIGREFDLPYP